MNDKPNTIDIIVGGKRFGMRTWRSVPRVGDFILVSGGEKTVQVKKVVWSDVGEDAAIYDCWIQLVCKEVEHMAAKKGDEQK